MVSDDFLPAATGVGMHVQCIAAELARRGHRVCVITTRRRGEPGFELWKDIRVYRTFTMKVYGFYQALASRSTIKRILDDNAVDVIHYHYLGILLMRTVKAAASSGAKQVYTYHMPVEVLTQAPLMRPLHGLFVRLHVKYCNRFDLVLAPSAGLLKQIGAAGIHTPTHVLSNPIVIDVGAEPAPRSAAGDFVVLYAGRLGPEKNLPYLLRAFASLVDAGVEAALWIAGEGPLRAELVRLSEELGVAGRVKFLGFVQHADLARLYAAADVFVLPSLLETQGMVVMEAMCFGKPVIVTDRIVAARELVDDGKNGYIVDPESTDDLSEKLRRLSEAPDLCREMGRQSLHKSQSYTPSAIVSALEQHYATVLSER